jgi:pilus assembly protein CpaB
MRTKLALLAAVILGILAAIGVQRIISQKEQEFAEKGRRVRIAVARETLNVGDILQGSKVGGLEVEEAAVTDMHILFDQVKPYLGQTLTRKVPANNCLMKIYFIAAPEREEFSVKKVDRDMRAVTIGTDQIAGVAGLITPGSRVDVLGTFRVAGRGPESTATVVTKVLARNVQVIAVDNRTDVRIPLRPGRGGEADRGYSSITLHVNPLEASLMTFAQGAGKLSFTLRNLDDRSMEPVPDITLSEFDNLIADADRRRVQSIQKSPGATLPPVPPAPRQP